MEYASCGVYNPPVYAGTVTCVIMQICCDRFLERHWHACVISLKFSRSKVCLSPHRVHVNSLTSQHPTVGDTLQGLKQDLHILAALASQQ